MLEKKITFDSFIRGTISGIIIIGILYLINYLSSVLLPFFIAWLIAYMSYPLVAFFQYKLKLKNRVASIFAAMFVLLIAILLIVVGIIPPIAEEFNKLKDLISIYFIGGSQQAAIPEVIESFIKEHVNIVQIQNTLSEENISKILQNILPRAWNLFTHSVNVIVSIFAMFIILLYTFFILLDYETIASGWIGLVPIKYREMTIRIVTDVKDGMNKYFRGQALVAFLVGILFSIGFLIIDFPLAIGFGLFIGVLNMVPYLQLLALVPTVLLAFLKAADSGENFWWVLFLAFAVFCVVQTIQDFIIVPRIMGKITGLNPAVILLSLSIWGALMGIVGMIIALPCTTIILSYYKRYIKKGEEQISPKSEEAP